MGIARRFTSTYCAWDSGFIGPVSCKVAAAVRGGERGARPPRTRNGSDPFRKISAILRAAASRAQGLDSDQRVIGASARAQLSGAEVPSPRFEHLERLAVGCELVAERGALLVHPVAAQHVLNAKHAIALGDGDEQPIVLGEGEVSRHASARLVSGAGHERGHDGDEVSLPQQRLPGCAPRGGCALHSDRSSLLPSPREEKEAVRA